MSAPTLLARLRVAFPSQAKLFAKTEAAQTPLNDLKRQIWEARTEYWYRKISGYPQVMEAAKGEAKGLMDKLSRPGDLTYGDVATGFICGVQVFGCFCIGEMVGRQNIQGYKVKGDHFDHHH